MEKWVRGKTIGHGSFATVTLAKPTNPISPLPPVIAVKSSPASHSASLVNERLVLEELKDCPEIINCFGDSVTVENGVKLYNVALEYAAGGALSEIKNSPENEVRRYTKSILNGLQFIHRKGYVHCDIKAQNILLFADGNVKIADFGLAKKMKEKWGEMRGTPMYMAPETVAGGEQESPADVWAVGCLVSEMISGGPVWECSGAGDLLMKIGVGGETPKIPAKLSEEGKDFIGKCFLKDPRERWTAEMLLRHPFVRSGLGTLAGNQISPRDVFDFPDWESDESEEVCDRLVTPKFGLVTEMPAVRLGQLMTDQRPDWSGSESWVKVR